ncbi:hypothetical protein SKAU_G00204700 [Synaphobranchus kaupii]|uniref:Ig-like domain-containing protein n=1 Tax=Synaphobranchus kaupii TaxID=118154 RepID=A0A9Q1FG45_SYNKA|nr:hypothetical protein SKAU_G00204700 [Synaphobranchus kaupii]
MVAGRPDVCFSVQSLAGIIFTLTCFLPSCLPAGRTGEGTLVDTVTSRQGDTALLRCYLLDGLSKGAWLNRSSIMFTGGDKWSADPRVSVVTGGGNKHEYSLQIQKVDISDEGRYTCVVQNNLNPQSNHIFLSVKVPPKIYDVSSDVTVNEGGNVSLFCMASGRPEPSISWRHITPLAMKYQTGEDLNISGITKDQAGEYECIAQNDASAPNTKSLRVTVNYPPSIHEMKFTGVGVARTALLRCEALGVPTPAFEWYRGTKRLTRAQGTDIQTLRSRSVLSMTNMTQDRYGNYTCVAVNMLGKASASMPLLPPSTASYGGASRVGVALVAWLLPLVLFSFLAMC